MRVIVIGAGPAGLTTLKTLLHFPVDPNTGERPFDPILLEADPSRIGGTFAQRSYENGTLVSSKQLTAFSDYRFPLDAPDHATMPNYVNYLEGYAERFGLRVAVPKGSEWAGTEFEGKERLRSGIRVTRVEKVYGEKGTTHMVFYKEGEEGEERSILTHALSICTGLHVLPAVFSIPGLSNLIPQSPPISSPSTIPSTPPPFTLPSPPPPPLKPKDGVRVIHSSQYKRREEFKDRRVVIMGVGETGMDLAYEAVMGGAKEIILCHRGGFLSFPKVLNDFQVFGIKFEGDLPIDGLITNLFETAYVHPWIAASHVRWFISDFVIKRVLWFLTGTSAGCNQWVGELPDERLGRAYVFLNKSSKAMPYINEPYKPNFTVLANLLGTRYIDPPAPPTTASHISLAPWPTSISPSGQIHFTTPLSAHLKRREEIRMAKRVVKPDMLVYATGYRQVWDWLGEGDEYPKGPEDVRVDVRGICERRDVSVGWIGYVRPGVGAIPPIAEQQAMLWSLLLLEKVPVPTSEPDYKLLARPTARIQYGVDHSAYMSTLAKDMGASPSLWQLYREYGLHVLVCYCFGAAFVPFYRLTGPFKDPEHMSEIVKTEIWETITRRGILGNLFMGLIPMVFYGIVNGLALLVEIVWTLLGKPEVKLLGLRKGLGPMPVRKQGKVM